MSEESSLSPITMTIMIAAVCLLFFWAALARSYERDQRHALALQNEEETQDFEQTLNLRRRTGALKVFAGSLLFTGWNAIVQVPNVFSVINNGFKNHLWLMILGGCVLSGVVGMGLVFAKVEQQMAPKPTVKRKKKKKKRPIA